MSRSLRAQEREADPPRAQWQDADTTVYAWSDAPHTAEGPARGGYRLCCSVSCSLRLGALGDADPRMADLAECSVHVGSSHRKIVSCSKNIICRNIRPRINPNPPEAKRM